MQAASIEAASGKTSYEAGKTSRAINTMKEKPDITILTKAITEL